MSKHLWISNLVIFFFAFQCSPVYSQSSSSLQERLFDDIRDHSLDDFTHIQASFILSGANDPDTLQQYLQWYNDLVATIKGFHFDQFDRVSSANKIFNYLRATQLKEYRLESTTLVNIMREKKYNCVSSTILYNLICAEFGWGTEAFETPTHVYTIFPNFGQNIMVENTHPMGFNILGNLQAYSIYLSQFYPENRILKIGLDRLHAHEQSKGRRITNTELLGLLTYNLAYFARQKNEFEKAYNLVLVAQDFNRDSRSNINFEIGLYYAWGQQCFKDKRFHDAFKIFADGYYRYPDNKDFIKNTRASFYYSIKHFWKIKNWHQSSELIGEVLELDVFEQADFKQLQPVIINWAIYLLKHKNKTAAKEAVAYIETLFPSSQYLNEFNKEVE